MINRAALVQSMVWIYYLKGRQKQRLIIYSRWMLVSVNSVNVFCELTQAVNMMGASASLKSVCCDEHIPTHANIHVHELAPHVIVSGPDTVTERLMHSDTRLVPAAL